MGTTVDTKINLRNQSATISIDLFGGAITDFHLRDYRLNTLSFCFSPEQMPENNRNGAPYQGHFLCLGRWGVPTPGEVKGGMPNHGQFANVCWEAVRKDALEIATRAFADLEHLSVNRVLTMDDTSAIFHVRETVTNIGSLGRMYNMVQHPTICAPFLDTDLIVDCNAARGFDYLIDEFSDGSFTNWPMMLSSSNQTIDLSRSSEPYSSVFSFIVDPAADHGWVTAYSPSHELLLGYIWRRSDYPWINHWIHWENGVLMYRGLEFGTTGLHKPFVEILERKLLELMDERTYAYLDAGDSCTRSYLGFLHKTRHGFTGVADVKRNAAAISIREKESGQEITIPLSLNF